MSGIFIGIIIIALTVTLRVLRPKIKGRMGERIVSARLNTYLSDDYHILDDLILKTDRGTTQIDHVVVSKYGIFVIETKNCKGWIFGHENSEKWTQNLYGYKYPLVNPVRQNRAHIRAIRQTLSDVGRYPVISIVAFSGKASLNVTVERAHVIYWRDLASTIKQYRTEVIDDEQVQRIAATLQQANVTTADRNREHVKQVRQTAAHYEHALASGFCPRCGGRLVERKGAYGRFYGCSNYPKCKFTQRI